MIDDIMIPGYQIVRQLGQGGTATVYLAIQNSFGREVALKIMSPLLHQDPTFSSRFKREARIVSQMHHASIVPVFDVGEHLRHHYLSMELLPGGDLRQRIVSGKCTPAVALEICAAIGSALDLAHRKGFVHRDIKPQNILFRENGTPVLTDFGIARAIDVGTSLTATGMFVGTPNYMSPEQVKGLELDGRSDLYSLGIVLYEMLTGKVPYQADSALSIALKHLSDPLPLLPPELVGYQAFLNLLTAKDRAQRFATSAEVIRAISTLTPLPAKQAATLVRERDNSHPMWQTGSNAAVISQSTSRWSPWSAAALAAAMALGGGFYLWQPTQRPAVEPRTRDTEVTLRQQRQIASLLADAGTSFAAGALIKPPASNAADYYRAVLKLEPQQAEAIAGLRRIADALVTQAERERKAGELDAALRSLAEARSVQPDHPRIAALQTDIEKRRTKLRLRAQQQLAAAGEHLARARVYLDRTPVTLRNVAEANDHYDKAVENAASVPELDLTRDRIQAGYVAAARRELNAKQPARALKVLTYARKRDMTSAALDKIEAQIRQQPRSLSE